MVVKLKKIQDDQYEIIDRGEENFHHIKLNETAPYPDVVYQYGAVSLFEENDSLRVKFDYEVFANPKMLDTKSRQFIDYIGHVLMTNLEELLIYNKYSKGSTNVV